MLRLELGETELPGVLEVILIGLGQILPGVRECSAIHFFKVRVILLVSGGRDTQGFTGFLVMLLLIF